MSTQMLQFVFVLMYAHNTLVLPNLRRLEPYFENETHKQEHKT